MSASSRFRPKLQTAAPTIRSLAHIQTNHNTAFDKTQSAVYAFPRTVNSRLQIHLAAIQSHQLGNRPVEYKVSNIARSRPRPVATNQSPQTNAPFHHVKNPLLGNFLKIDFSGAKVGTSCRTKYLKRSQGDEMIILSFHAQTVAGHSITIQEHLQPCTSSSVKARDRPSHINKTLQIMIIFNGFRTYFPDFKMPRKRVIQCCKGVISGIYWSNSYKNRFASHYQKVLRKKTIGHQAFRRSISGRSRVPPSSSTSKNSSS